MTGGEALRAALEAHFGYLALGNRCFEAAGARFVRCDEAPEIWDANHVARVRCDGPGAIEALLRRAAEVFADRPYLRFHCDPLTPPALEAQLALEDFEVSGELLLLLEGPVRGPAARFDIRLAETDGDWERLRELARVLALEEARRLRRAPYPESVSRALVDRRRAKAPAVRTWIARVDGVDSAHLSSWPGTDGVGKVEDLFTLRAFRHRGIATALLHHAVADARERGATAVVIGSDPGDTPKRMYRALGFRPLCVVRAWHRARP